jgi:hypothetical protein
MRKMRTRYFVIPVAIATAAGTAGVALAFSPPPQHVARTASRAATRVTSNPSALRRADHAFAVLRRHSAHASDAAASQGGGVLALTQGDFTARVSQETNGEVCLLTGSSTEAQAKTCDHPQHAAEVGIVLITETSGQPARVTALVPDGVSTVTVSTGGTQTSMTVTNNVASGTFSKLDGVTFTAPGGTPVTVAAPSPPAVPPAQ